MQNCNNCEKIKKLDELSLEIYALFDILERALKCDEFEKGQNSSTLYLSQIIRDKLEELIEKF